MISSKYTDVVMYNISDCSDNYWKILGRLWQSFRHKPAIDANGAITHFSANNNNKKKQADHAITARGT